MRKQRLSPTRIPLRIPNATESTDQGQYVQTIIVSQLRHHSGDIARVNGYKTAANLIFSCLGVILSYAHYPSLKGKHVFVTGGASGIGRCIVEHFIEQGATVLP